MVTPPHYLSVFKELYGGILVKLIYQINSGVVMIKAVIFDSGGVLTTDTDNLMSKNIARSFGISKKKVMDAFDSLATLFQTGKITQKEFWVKFAKAVCRNLPSGYSSLLLADYEKASRKNESVFLFAKKLKKKGYIVAVLSNTVKVHANFNKKRKLWKGFDKVFLSCDLGMIKPNVDIYRYTLRKLKIKAKEAVMIDNKKDYLAGAKKIGMHTIVYRNLQKLKKDLRKLGVAW